MSKQRKRRDECKRERRVDRSCVEVSVSERDCWWLGQEEALIGQASHFVVLKVWRERDTERSLLNVTCHTCGTMRK